ncbi:penicillin-binding protein activator [Psychrobium sp. 1_MG-2023]|uniref:penicillin-binding protein activator n=1 Tax=Psychrobium sp. 1_MG-2023 TaxID=3062624 RepID=UPI00273683EA|nr:penicillin-binding protein activator [Psychrobium sp. 1_MG-2023]MDP2559624.1 penicillin-binding protein activator [Psychrobium sp. 1_MG-2023]
MFKLSFTKELKQLSLLGVLATGLIGCGSTPPVQKTEVAQVQLGQVDKAASHYLALAEQAIGNLKQTYQLQAYRAALQDKQPDLISSIEAQLFSQTMVNDQHTLEFQLLYSMSLLEQNKANQALSAININPQWQVASQQFIAIYRQQALIEHRLTQHLDATKTLLTAYTYAQDQQTQQQLQQHIWQYLSQVPTEKLITTSDDNKQFQGWIALATLSHQSTHSPQALRKGLTQWAIDYPNHMAKNQLPQRLVTAVSVSEFKPQKVALLLPLSGRYAHLGQAVQNGLVSNLMAHNNEQELIVLDTIELGAQAAHEQAINQGAEFIIGPLLKKNVETVKQQLTMVPTLFLNQTSDNQRQPQQYFYSLDKDSETIQGSEYIFNQGKKHPVVVAPNTAQGKRLAALFNDTWLALNKESLDIKPVEAFFFEDDKTLKLTIEKMFETNKSQARINHMRMLVGSKMESETRSRRDIDAIYLVANPNQTSMLMPSIEVTVSAFAPQVPVYIGSSGNNHLNSPQGLNHLNNLTVSEIPWLLQQPTAISPQYIKKLWPEISQSQMRLFAMGHDAYSLIGMLAQMEYFPDYALDGFSGQLRLTPQGEITREVAWAQYQRGKLLKKK